jgi:hypothetical protein
MKAAPRRTLSQHANPDRARCFSVGRKFFKLWRYFAGLTQIVSRGKQVEVPAKTQMTFRLECTLILQPTS